MKGFRERFRSSGEYVAGFIKWLLAGLGIGLAGGFVGALFHLCVEYATEVRQGASWLVWLLPVGGVLIALLYRFSKTVLDTNLVIRAIRSNSPVHAVMAPLIFVSTVISHFFGASVGREGAALQIGGTIGYQLGRLCRLDEEDRHIMVMCGMSAVFAANFGTPVTAAVFSIEVASVGLMHYAGLLPCLLSAVLGTAVAGAMGVEPMGFALETVPSLTLRSGGQALVLGVLCALLSIVFCVCLHNGEHLAKKLLPNSFLRAAAGGLLLAVLTWLCGGMAYNGAGTGIIAEAIGGRAWTGDFALKMAFTVISISAGFKGGEIVPTMFVGATFGCVLGPLLGMDAGFAAALCLVGLFCGMVNCPLASIVLSVELFGAEGFPLFAVVCAVSYMLSGRYSLYRDQDLVYSKVKDRYAVSADFINRS